MKQKQGKNWITHREKVNARVDIPPLSDPMDFFPWVLDKKHMKKQLGKIFNPLIEAQKNKEKIQPELDMDFLEHLFYANNLHQKTCPGFDDGSKAYDACRNVRNRVMKAIIKHFRRFK